ncbi:hypothetical protein [Staphylococcus coagulans]|uniref:hypothetical protein n=1 Tax=Staphylococcus coagulans TaxID=74706 RepID=UPI0015FE3B2D|nr:hypothetical protein [Staphylococcus coagulans]MBA8759130.1 hypothetical protein [Staphylococcus coagulans]MBA8761515.1 hypothetical protein [Staphylococcus coagulans]MBA8768091.1 hypothetical protein [Staphylococcus coagulans]
MIFNNWNITINGKGSYETITNEDTLLILLNYQHVEFALKMEEDSIQVKSLGYNHNVTIHPSTKEIIVNLTNLLDDDE